MPLWVIACLVGLRATTALPLDVNPINDQGQIDATIVSAYRSGKITVLQLHAGLEGGMVKVGQLGHILVGDTDKYLPHGAFHIAQVLDDSQSIAHTSMALKLLGRNSRVVIKVE